VLLRTLAPTVAVVNNGPRKGGEPGSFATLASLSSLQGIYQVHRNVRVGPGGNTSPELTANSGEEDCQGHGVSAAVEPNGRHYTVSVESTGHRRTYAAHARAAGVAKGP
jgi:hypothetical protein